MVKLNDRIFWSLNKKPTGPTNTYFSIVGPWIVVGVILMFGILTITVYLSNIQSMSIQPLFIGLVIIGLSVGLGILNSIGDSKKGYIKSIHNNYLAQRKEIAERLNKKV